MGPYVLLLISSLYGSPATMVAVEMSGKVACDAAKEEILKVPHSHIDHVLCLPKTAQLPK